MHPMTEQLYDDIRRSGELPGEVGAEQALEAVFCVLAQRITGGEADDITAVFPQDLKERLDPCVRQAGERGEAFDRKEFLSRVGGRLGISKAEAQAVSHRVFKALKQHIPEGQVADVEGQLPRDMASMWRGES